MNSPVRSLARAASMLVSASFGCFAYGLLYLCGDKSKTLNYLLSLYPPSGALSGVLVLGTLAWLVAWFALAARWRSKTPPMNFVVGLATTLLLAALLFTFPPFVRSI